MSEIIRAINEAAASLRASMPKRMEVWVTRALDDEHHAARIDLVDRILFFISPGALRRLEGATRAYTERPYLVAGSPVREFDSLPGDSALTLALSVAQVSPAFAARLVSTNPGYVSDTC